MMSRSTIGIGFEMRLKQGERRRLHGNDPCTKGGGKSAFISLEWWRNELIGEGPQEYRLSVNWAPRREVIQQSGSGSNLAELSSAMITVR